MDTSSVKETVLRSLINAGGEWSCWERKSSPNGYPVLLKCSVQLLTLHISDRNYYPFQTRIWDYRLKIGGICIISYIVIFMATTRVSLESISLLWLPALAHFTWWQWAFYTPHSTFAKPAKQKKGGHFLQGPLFIASELQRAWMVITWRSRFVLSSSTSGTWISMGGRAVLFLRWIAIILMRCCCNKRKEEKLKAHYVVSGKTFQPEEKDLIGWPE